MNRRQVYVRGFALPTVLIASVVMMIVLTASVSSVVAVRTSLKTQYYEQLAKAAGEAGVAYAKACLAKNGNVPLWGASSNPLTPATDCAGNVVVDGCPSNADCSVTVSGNVRSSFSVPRPRVDANGRAVTIANSGYVELLRASNGAVWRKYYQPSVQSAAVPDLCSGAAKTALGWVNAVQSTPAVSLPDASSAATIGATTGAEAGGYMYFRKDFPVFEGGAYNASVLTPSVQDVAEIYVDGNYVTVSTGNAASSSVNLDPGCHTVLVRLKNSSLMSRQSSMAAAIQRSGSSPVVATDTTWRVEVGSVAHYSSPDYFVDTALWVPVINKGVPGASWTNTGDTLAQVVAAACDSSCPAGSTTYFRNSRDLIITTSTEVKVSATCDDECNVYMNGDLLMTSGPSNPLIQQTITLNPGSYGFGVGLYNATGSASASSFAMTVLNTGDTNNNTNTLMRSDSQWQTTNNNWFSGNNTGTGPQSYAASFVPSPNDLNVALASILAVGGGGAGGNNAAGGGGAGGVVYVPRQELKANTTYAVAVGAGGTGVASTSVSGARGANSSFGGSLIVANGGGGGASRDGGTHTANNGSSGGGAGATTTGVRDIPGVPTVGQGNSGGAGQTTTTYLGGGGGGAGGFGSSASGTAAGVGGIGYINYMAGVRVAIAGGGGASGTGSAVYGAGSDGGARGSATLTPPPAATSGTGGGGGAGGGATGSTGGNGGSGIVIIRYPTGSIDVTTTGSRTTGTYLGYTYVRFTGAGTFTITAIK